MLLQIIYAFGITHFKWDICICSRYILFTFKYKRDDCSCILATCSLHRDLNHLEPSSHRKNLLQESGDESDLADEEDTPEMLRQMVDAENVKPDDPIGSDEPGESPRVVDQEIAEPDLEPAEPKEVSERKALGTKE